MPEGDTLWNIAHRLGPLLQGRTADEVQVHRPRYRPPAPGSVVESVTARGKHLLITFEGGTVVHTHLQMSGQWHAYRVGERWKDSPGAVRVRIRAGDIEAVCFRAPTVDVYPAADPRPRPWDRIGPDLCDPEPDLDTVMVNLRALDPDTEVADALLDQRVAAGIGNVYKSETLWACQVDPFLAVGDLDPGVGRDLYRTASRLLRSNLGRSRRQTFGRGLAVYGRNGRDCPRCHRRLRIARQGDLARVTYWCGACQGRGDVAGLSPGPAPGPR